ncbi:MAG: hypothetical protein MZU79_06965 [Anaerotruncus sp.]|nr:hypothetical protein [Anaerotruncus sp.]
MELELRGQARPAPAPESEPRPDARRPEPGRSALTAANGSGSAHGASRVSGRRQVRALAAAFTSRPGVAGRQARRVQFTDASTGAPTARGAWNFRDGSTSASRRSRATPSRPPGPSLVIAREPSGMRARGPARRGLPAGP